MDGGSKRPYTIRGTERFATSRSQGSEYTPHGAARATESGACRGGGRSGPCRRRAPSTGATAQNRRPLARGGRIPRGGARRRRGLKSRSFVRLGMQCPSGAAGRLSRQRAAAPRPIVAAAARATRRCRSTKQSRCCGHSTSRPPKTSPVNAASSTTLLPVHAFPRLACARLSQARTGDLQKECCTRARLT